MSKLLFRVRFFMYGMVLSSIFNVILLILGLELGTNKYILVSLPILILLLPVIMYFDNKYIVKKFNK